MNLPSRRRLYYRQPQTNLYRLFLWAALILAGLWLVYGINRGSVQPMGAATPTPTRTMNSYLSEADTRFLAGDIPGAINAYKRATALEPQNVSAWANLARIQTYYSALQNTDEEQRRYLTDALYAINQAKALAPDDSLVIAIRALVLDWNSNPTIAAERSPDLLAEAEQEAVRAVQLDNTNILGLVVYAEILIDQLKLTQAGQYLQQAFERGEETMDLHRVNAYYLESQGQYSAAIEEYDRAIAIAPNLTFLYLRAGANYRQLAFISPVEAQQEQLYEKSLEYFAKAAGINEQLGIKNPTPYLSIAKTYSQTGDYLAASLNVQKALEYEPSNPDVYGQLGIVYQKSRNYEGAIPAFKCATYGCDAEESCIARYGRACDPDFGESGIAISGQAISNNTVIYYFSYVSMLAALSRPQQNYCPLAREVMADIRSAGFGGDSLVSQILAENENICQIVDAGGPLALRTATATPPPDLETAPTPSATPNP